MWKLIISSGKLFEVLYWKELKGKDPFSTIQKIFGGFQKLYDQ